MLTHYLPLNTNLALHISKMRKVLYILCEELDRKKTIAFLQQVRKKFAEQKLDFFEYDPGYLELFLLNWESTRFISKTDIDNIKNIFKLMGEESIYVMLDVNVQEEQEDPVVCN